jgi:hypothetical protein
MFYPGLSEEHHCGFPSKPLVGNQNAKAGEIGDLSCLRMMSGFICEGFQSSIFPAGQRQSTVYCASPIRKLHGFYHLDANKSGVSIIDQLCITVFTRFAIMDNAASVI